MSEIVLRCIQMATSIFEVWLCYQVAYVTVLDEETMGWKEKIIEWANILGLGVLLGINRSLAFFSYTMLLICVTITSLFIWFIKHENFLLIIGIVSVMYFVIALLDLFLAFLSMVVLQESFINAVFIHATSMWNGVIYLCSRFIGFGLVQFFKWHKCDIRYRIQDYRWICIGVSVLLYISIRRYITMMDGMAKRVNEMNGIIAGFSLLTIVLFIFSISAFLFKYHMIKKEKEILMLRDNMMEERYREMIKCNQMVHDMKNHFIIMQKYEKEENWEKLSNYIDEIGGAFLDVNVKDWTGISILDMILSQKKTEAEHRGISFEIDTVPLKKLPLTDSETISLFGNLLDNAIEACEMKVEGERWIEVKIRRQNQMLFIQTKNSTIEKAQKNRGELRTSKKDKYIHGYGIKSIKEIVQRHEGTFSYHVENSVFSVNLEFFDNSVL